nr:ankyrin repeat-containing protein [Tanacetum cinerariifolium]
MEQFKIDQLEENLEQFKIDQAAINSEAAKQRALLRATIEKNKVEADRQFAEIINALKALQPPITLPATIPRFEENNGQSFSSVEVEKEEKDIGFLGALVIRSEVADGYGGENLPQTDSILKNFEFKRH